MRRCLLVRGVILNSAFFAVQFTLHSVFLRAWSCMFFDGLAYVAKSVLEAFVADISVAGFGIRVANGAGVGCCCKLGLFRCRVLRCAVF